MDNFVLEQLINNGLDSYIDVFKENEIDHAAFLALTKEHLKELLPGKIGPQAKLLSAITTLQSQEQGSDTIDFNSSLDVFSASLSTRTDEQISSFGNDQMSAVTEHVGKALIYIDNSNIFINSQKHSAIVQKFGFGIRFDNRCRLDVGKIYSCARGEYDVLEAHLHGSEPPLLDTVWKAIRKKDVIVKTHKKSSWTNKEKEIDTTLVADAVEGITSFKLAAGEDRKLILFTGDKDMLIVIRKARQHGWKVDVWSYKMSLSNGIKREAKKHPEDIRIKLIDDYFAECTYTATEWKKPQIPFASSMVILLDCDIRERERKRRINEIVKSCTGFLKIPLIAQFLPSKYELKAVEKNTITTSNRFSGFNTNTERSDNQYYTALALICCNRSVYQKSEKNDTNCVPVHSSFDFTKNVFARKGEIKLSVSDCYDIMTYQEYMQGIGPQDDLASESHDDLDWDDDDPDFNYIHVEQKVKKMHQKYSTMCDYRYRCKHGLKCTYGHTEQEKEFFKTHPNARRMKYKTQLCMYTHRSDLPACRFMAKSYLCMYAHDFYEYMCCNCGEIGIHYSDECPDL